MRILKDFKVPDFKFPKFKMKGLSNIEEMKVDYESLEKEAKNKGNKKSKNYEITNYKTIKEICEVVAWVDEKYKEIPSVEDFVISSPEKIMGKSFDVIYVALTNGKESQNVYEKYVDMGVDRRKII